MLGAIAAAFGLKLLNEAPIRCSVQAAVRIAVRIAFMQCTPRPITRGCAGGKAVFFAVLRKRFSAIVTRSLPVSSQ